MDVNTIRLTISFNAMPVRLMYKSKSDFPSPSLSLGGPLSLSRTRQLMVSPVVCVSVVDLSDDEEAASGGVGRGGGGRRWSCRFKCAHNNADAGRLYSLVS